MKATGTILVFYDQSDLSMFCGKMSDFISFPLFGFTLVIKLKIFDFESHWNTLIFLDEKDMLSDLNMFHGKMSDFVLFPLLRFTLVIKLRNFDFESHQNYYVRFDYQKASDLV